MIMSIDISYRQQVSLGEMTAKSIFKITCIDISNDNEHRYTISTARISMSNDCKYRYLK